MLPGVEPGTFRLEGEILGTGTLDIRYEQFELEDYALVAPDTIPTVLTLGAEPYRPSPEGPSCT